MTATIDVSGRLSARPTARLFYVYMAAVCAAIAFLGFLPTYWAPMAAGAFKARPLVHIHGAVFFGWSLYFVLQTWLAASGRTAGHRALGMIGISLTTAMTILGVLAAINQMETATALGLAEAGRAFAIVPLGGIAFFATAIAVAVANRHRPEIHKRLMLLAAISILDAPMARWFMVFLAPPGASGPPPVGADIPPSIVVWLLLIAAMVFDWRTRGRPHPAYFYGGAALVTLKLAEVPISATPAWHSIAGAVLALAG